MSRSETIEIVWDEDDPFTIPEHAEPYRGENSLTGAKAWTRQRFRAGDLSYCPCCGQAVKRYARSISSSQIKAMSMIADSIGGMTSAQIMQRSKQGGGDYAKLAAWGLLDQNSATGYWHITDKGRDFLNGEIQVPKYVFFYNGRVLGRSTELVDVNQCRGRVTMDEVMRAAPEPAEEAVA